MSKIKKSRIVLLIAAIAIALIAGISTSVYSLMDNRVIIKLDDSRVWRCKDHFKDNWYINLKSQSNTTPKKVSFNVDLSGYLNSIDDPKADLEAPFTVSLGDGKNSDGSIVDITSISNVTISKVLGKPGMFDVTFKEAIGHLYGNSIQVNVSFPRGNDWGISEQVDSFNLNIDNVEPFCTIENYEKYTSNTIELNCTYEESNLDKVVVSGTIKHGWGENLKVINDVFPVESNMTSGQYTAIVLDKGNNNFKLRFNELGTYNVTVTLYDKAGNKFEINNNQFQKIVSNFGLQLKDVRKKGETYYAKGHEFEINATWSLFVNKSIGYKIFKESTHALVARGDIDSRKGTIAVPEDGTYDLELCLIKDVLLSQETEYRNYKVKFDSKSPSLIISADGERINFETSNEVYYKEKKNINISLTDENISERNIEVFKGNRRIESTNSESLDFIAEEEGTYEIRIYSEDYSGNITQGTYNVYIDKQNPKLELSGVEDKLKIKAGINNETPTAIVKAYDENLQEAKVVITKESKNEPLKRIEDPLINGQEYRYDVVDNGKYTLTVTAKDKSGRISSIDTIKFEKDINPPSLTLKVDDREIGDCEYNINDMPYIKNVNGVKIDAEICEDYPKLKDDGTLDEESTYIEVKRTPVDQEGNISDTQESVEYFANSKSINLVDDGKYEVTIYSEDNCGNKKERTLYFVLDGTAPNLTVEGYKGYYSSTPDIQIRSKDAFQIDGHIDITYIKTIKHLDKDDEVYPEETRRIDIDSKDIVVKLSELDEFKDEAEYKISSIKAFDKADNESELKDINYSFDTEAPSKSISGITDEKKYYDSDRNIEVNVEDINLDKVSIKFTKNGEDYEPTEEEIVKPLTVEERKAYASYLFSSDAEYKVFVEAIDKSGNGEKDILEKEFVVDKTFPVINIEDYDLLNGSYINYDKALKVNINEKYLKDDIESTYVRIVKKYPGEEGVAADYKFELNGDGPDYSNIYNEFTEDAEYTVTVVAKDEAGNERVSPSLIFTVDKTVPVQSIIGVENDAYYNVDKDVQLISIDNNQSINTAVVTRDGEEYHVDEFTIEGIKAILTHTFSGEGTYEITFTTTDKAGNTAISTIKFTIDKTAPDIKAVKGDDGSELKFGEYINRIFTPQFILDKSEDFITQVTLNGADVTGNVSMASQEMEYNYTVTAQDKAGNVTTIDSLFTVDTTNPAISISGIMSGFFNEDLTPEFDITDTNLDYANTSSTLNGQAFTSGTKIEEQNDFNLKLIGTDLATNSNSQSISFTIDKDGPVIKFENPIAGKYFTEDFIPKFLIEDLSDYTIITLTLDGEEYHIGDVIEEEGKHVLYVEVMDKAGNISELSVEFILDKTAPKFIIDGVTDGETYYDAMSATVMLDNPLDTINAITVNGEAANGETSDEYGQQMIKLDFNDIDDYEVMLKGTDEAGNSTIQTVKFTVAEKTLLSKVTTNKKLLYSSLAAVVAILVSGTTGFLLRKRKKLKLSVEEDIEIEE